MPSLYRLRLGPINTAYYQQHFDRFESQGKVSPTWNSSAAFFTLAWLLLRQMPRPAMLYAGCLLTFLTLWWFGLHGNVPLPVEMLLCLLGAGLLCIVPGIAGNALYYQYVRKETMTALNSASTLSQAQIQLQSNVVTKERLNVAIAGQGVVAVLLTALLASQINWARLTAAPTPPAPSGPPNLVIPPVGSVQRPPLEHFTPDMPLLQPEPETPATPDAPAASQPGASQSTPPAPVTPQALAITSDALPPSAAGSANAAATPAPSAPAADSTTTALPLAAKQAKAREDMAREPAPDQLSVLTMAQSVPAQATAAIAGAAATVSDKAGAAQKALSTSGKTAAQPAKEKPASKEKPVKAAEPAPRAPAGLVPGKFYLNAGVYAQTANADRAVKTLQAAKLPVLRQTLHSNKGEMTRLRIGPFDTRAQANKAVAQARQFKVEASVFQHPAK